MKAYTFHKAHEAYKASHGSNGWVETETGDFMKQLGEEEIANLLTHGITEFYIEAPDGDIVAKPFENLGLFGAQPEPAKRFAKAELRLVRVQTETE